MSHFLKCVLAPLLACCIGPAAIAATALPQQITVIVPYAPGGAVDALTRILAKQLAADQGINLIVENKPGAGGSIAAQQAVRGKPDGRTLLMGTSNTHGINSVVIPGLKYDPIKDFTAVADVAENIVILAANKDFPANTLTEAVDLIARSPGKYSFGSPGVGSVHALAMEQFAQKLGLNITHVAYKGAGPAMTDTVAGNIPLVMAGVVPAKPFLADKRIKILGIANPRDDMFSGVAEVAQTQYFSDIQKDTSVQSWIGLFAPVGLAPDLADSLHAAFEKVIKSEAFAKELTPLGMVPNISSRQAFADKVSANVQSWQKALSSTKPAKQ